MKGFAESLAGSGRNDDVVQQVAIVEGVAAQLVRNSSKGYFFEFITFSEGIALHLFHASRNKYVIQSVTIIESIVLYLFHAVGDIDTFELFLASKCHLADDNHSLRNGELLILAHAVHQSLFVGSIYRITIKLKTVAVDFLQGEVEY